MQQGIELPTTIEALKEKAHWLDKALDTATGRAFDTLLSQYNKVQDEIERRRLLQTTLENL